MRLNSAIYLACSVVIFCSREGRRARSLQSMIAFFQMLFTSISGHETTAALLSFCVLELGDHPDIVERLVIL